MDSQQLAEATFDQIGNQFTDQHYDFVWDQTQTLNLETLLRLISLYDQKEQLMVLYNIFDHRWFLEDDVMKIFFAENAPLDANSDIDYAVFTKLRERFPAFIVEVDRILSSYGGAEDVEDEFGDNDNYAIYARAEVFEESDMEDGSENDD